MNNHPIEAFDELESMIDGSVPMSDSVGDPLDETPTQDITRIYVQNLNGLCWNNDGGKWPYVCEVMTTIQADIACFSEINTAVNRFDIRSKMESICRQHFCQNSLVMSTSQSQSSSRYSPGGTAILARDAITTRIQSQTRDRMGRWTSICLKATSSRKIRIISAYQVCKNVRPGTNTAASQQMAQLILERSPLQTHKCDPRQAFIFDLHRFITQCQRNGEDILLVGDFNDDITSTDSGMKTIATDCRLVDLFSVRLGSPNIPATYQRGSKRLDYVLLSPTLLPVVTAAGYDPFGYRLPSDHRGMYLDISSEALFEHMPPQLATVSKREFRTTDPRAIQNYVTAKTKYLTDHEFFARLQVLENLVEPNHELAEALDRDFQRASHHAARKSTKKSRPPWSPELARAWAELHYYRLLLSSVTTTANYQPAIHKLITKWPDLPVINDIDRHELLHRQKATLAKLKAIRSNAQQSREDFLTRHHAKSLAEDDTTKARILRRILRAETQHQVYMKLKYLRARDQAATAFTSLKIPRQGSPFDTETMKTLPDDDEHWETVTVPEQIEELLLERNRRHFGQAEGTPFTQQPLNATVGFKADGYNAEFILDGTFRCHNLPTATQLFLRHLQQRTITTIDAAISTHDVLQKLKRWKETTTTSPSGLHLGHYHCSWRDPGLPKDDPSREEFLHHQKQLLRATVSLLNYAIKFGHVYERWTKIVNVMLQKDPGNPRIHRLRVIHIYEADYNLLLAVKWRQVLHHAEDHRLLNNGLYGSRPGRSAHDPAFMEVLQHDIYRTSMKPGIHYDLDASSCYDRILTNVAVLSSRRVGLSKQVAFVNALTLEKARYHIKTQLGTSTNSYSHSATQPIHGTGQGSGNSPTIWCFLCSALFDAFQSAAHGSHFTDYANKIQESIFMTGFVDDCSQRVNGFRDNDTLPSDLIPLMEHDAQLWNDLLWASGGILEQSKCSFYMIASDWNLHGQPFLKGGTTNTSIHIVHNGHRIPTYQKSNYESHKTLGCYITPAYTNAQAWKVLSKKNETFAQLLEMNFLSRQESWVLYTSIYLPSLTHSLSINPLSKAQCHKLDARFLRTLLPRVGYNRNMSRAIRYAPVSMGGAGFRDLYIEQGALMLQLVYKFHNSSSTTIGKMLYMATSWTQAFLGTSTFFLSSPFRKLPPMNPSYLMDLRSFLQHIGGSIELHHPPVPPPLRRHDRYIMEIALEQTSWKPKHLIQINSCRRYLQAVTLADITNIQGTRLKPYVFTGRDLPSFSSTVRCSMFNQPLPTAQMWRTWKRFLLTISNTLGVLVQPLMEWIVDVEAVRHWPPYLYHPVSDTLLSHVHQNEYAVHHRYCQGCFSVRPTDRITIGFGWPTATQITMDTLRPTCNFQQPEMRESITLENIGLPHSVGVPAWEYNALRYCRVLYDLPTFTRLLTTEQLLVCSDGSVTTTGGYYGYVISTSRGHRLIRGKGMVPGSYHNSFRSEAYGVLAALRWMLQASSYYQIRSSAQVHHYLDNQSVIRRITKSSKKTWDCPNDRLQSDQDIIDEIIHTLSHLSINVNFEWVQGHQDQLRPFHLLSLPAKLNCEADKEATYAQSQCEYHPSIDSPFPSTPCRIKINNKYITSHLKRRIHYESNHPRLVNHLQQRFNWSPTAYHSIHWDLFQMIIKKYRDQWTTLVKHVHAISPTGHIAHRNNAYLPHECPLCSHPHEDNDHVIRCPHPSRVQWRTSTIHKAVSKSSDKVDPYLLDILRDGLIRYHKNLPPIQPAVYPEAYAILITNQNEVGWDQLYRARWVKHWAELQDSYCRSKPNNVPLSGNEWLLSLGRLLLDQWFQLWKLRNNDRHGAESLRESILREQTLHRELRYLYTKRLFVCPNDRAIFHDSVETHLQQHPDLNVLEAWITAYRPAILASEAQALRWGIIQNRRLTDYPTFNPISSARGHASLSAGMTSN